MWIFPLKKVKLCFSSILLYNIIRTLLYFNQQGIKNLNLFGLWILVIVSGAAYCINCIWSCYSVIFQLNNSTKNFPIKLDFAFWQWAECSFKLLFKIKVWQLGVTIVSVRCFLADFFNCALLLVNAKLQKTM